VPYDSWDEKPSECERGATTYWASYRPLEVHPSISRANVVDGATASESSKVQLGWEVWRNLPTAEGVLILIDGDSEAETWPTNDCLFVGLRGDSEWSSRARGGEGRTSYVICQSDAPRDRDEVPDDRKYGICLSSNN